MDGEDSLNTKTCKNSLSVALTYRLFNKNISELFNKIYILITLRQLTMFTTN